MQYALRHRKREMEETRNVLSRRNCGLARKRWDLEAKNPLLAALKRLSEELKLSVLAGEVILLQTNWYVTHAGLHPAALMPHSRIHRGNGRRQARAAVGDNQGELLAFQSTP